MRIRAFAPGDLEAVMRLASAVPEAPHWSRSTYESFLDAGAPEKQAFVAEDASRVIGFVAGQIAADVCELESIVVDSCCRRSGVGKRLTAAWMAWARERGAVKAQLEVRCGNHAAINFYEHEGFQREGLRRKYYRDPEEDALLMGMALEPSSEPSLQL